MTQAISTDQKIDKLTSMVADLTDTVVDLADLSGKTADGVKTLKDDVKTLKKNVSEMKDEQERQGKKLDQLAGSGSFSPNISGAFVA